MCLTAVHWGQLAVLQCVHQQAAPGTVLRAVQRQRRPAGNAAVGAPARLSLGQGGLHAYHRRSQACPRACLDLCAGRVKDGCMGGWLPRVVVFTAAVSFLCHGEPRDGQPLALLPRCPASSGTAVNPLLLLHGCKAQSVFCGQPSVGLIAFSLSPREG